MAVADDMNKLGKNQVALDQSFKFLQKKVNALEKRVVVLEGGNAYEEPVEEKATVKAESSKESSKPIENLGFKIFGGVGFMLILLGIFFLYRFAVDEGWIGIMGRIVLGIFFSLAILLAAEIIRGRGYAKFSQLLTGGGLALLYFTFFATYYFEQYREHLGMSLELNTILLTAVLIVAVLLSLRHDSMILAGTSFLFGYISAFLLSLADGAGFTMLFYALLLSVGMAIVLWKKNWPLGAYPVIASYVLYAIFFVSERLLRYSPDKSVPDVVVPGFIYLIAFWLLFSILSLVLKDDELHIQNILIAVANAFVFFGFGIALIWKYWHSWRGIFVIIIAGVYLIMAGIAKQRELKNLFETLFVLAVTFLTITIPVQLQGAWITVAWALEGLFLMRSSVNLKNKGLAVLSYVLIALATFRVLFWDSHALDYGWRTFSFLAVIAAYFATVYFQDEDNAMKGLLLVGGTIVLTVFLAVEILDPKGLFTTWSENARMVLCSVAWAVESVVLIVAGFINRSKVFRVVGLVLFGIVIVKILLLDLGSLNDISRTIVTILVGIIALVASFVYVKNKDKIKAFLEE
ncbi:DUF2339 domain-containing protein [Candidatus Woesearchaeota archaeon]|nr:DUF2339 domain-containing protein [Candidatus Woesearchaeota archaeon]